MRSTLLIVICAATLGLAAKPPALGQERLVNPTGTQLLLPRDLNAWSIQNAETAASPLSRVAKFRLFGMMPGFLNSPVGLDQDDEPNFDADTPSLLPRNADTTDNWIQVSLGPHNPFFDLRRRGDPGGVGFTKLDSQFQFFDTGRTGCNFGVQAVTPAGVENDGLSTGPTFISPALAMYYALDDGTSLHGYVSKHVRANSSWDNTLNQSIHYGVALQRPVGDLVNDSGQGLYFSIQALGRYKYNPDTLGSPARWEFVPGLHWRLDDNLWISGGYLRSLRNHQDPGFWQITCSWQF